ncbi:hypothetical protein [Novilysobacter erysipheiresistens]|uniref:Uncharacterized protein n=1 Tax=Novilysobacter erysipheiresistens TaxID=1749332 RepID=A0ABU7YTU7_9GAMM
MTNPIDARIAADNRAVRAMERRERAKAPKLPRPASDGIYNEPFANYGEDSGLLFRQETVAKFTALNNEVTKLYKNPVLTSNEKVLSAETKVKKLVAAVEQDIQEQWHLIGRKRTDISGRMANALRAPREDWRASALEVRSVLRGMSHDERNAFLRSMSGDAGDDAMLIKYAVASVPPELSGVPFETHKDMRDLLLALNDPKLLTEPKDLEERTQRLKALEQNVPLMARELVDLDRAAALRSLTED